jgi:hypothetical protein
LTAPDRTAWTIRPIGKSGFVSGGDIEPEKTTDKLLEFADKHEIFAQMAILLQPIPPSLLHKELPVIVLAVRYKVEPALRGVLEHFQHWTKANRVALGGLRGAAWEIITRKPYVGLMQAINGPKVHCSALTTCLRPHRLSPREIELVKEQVRDFNYLEELPTLYQRYEPLFADVPSAVLEGRNSIGYEPVAPPTSWT